MKKFLALFLTLALAASLAGCTGTEIRSYEPTESPSSTDEAVEAEGRDYEAARQTYALDEAVMTINGLDVTWSEYFYWVASVVSYLEYYYGEISDWSATCPEDSTQTYNEYVNHYAIDALCQYRALEYNAGLLEVTLDDEELALLDEQWLSDVTNYGGGDEATFEEYLESLFISKELYNYMNKVSYLYYGCFEKIYGENGELCPDDEAMSFADANGYISARHILVSTVDDEGEALPEDEKAAKLELAEDILAQLEAAEDLDARFDELMNEYSEDPSLLYYPEGYIFASGEMNAAFEEAAFALEEGGLSGIVESSFGYHIILRQPVDLDGVIEYYSASEQYTLRYTAAFNMFNAMVDSWVEEAETSIVWAGDFERLDFSSLFAS